VVERSTGIRAGTGTSSYKSHTSTRERKGVYIQKWTRENIGVLKGGTVWWPGLGSVRADVLMRGLNVEVEVEVEEVEHVRFRASHGSHVTGHTM